MDTNDLIRMLAMDTRRRVLTLRLAWSAAVAIAFAVAGAVFLATLSLRPDLAAAAQTPRFLFKLAITLSLAATAFFSARELSYPDDGWRKSIPYLAAAPILILAAVIAELFVVPPNRWFASMMGQNALACLASISMLGIAPLAIFLAVLRYGAPARPTLAGGVSGLFAGAIAATIFLGHCTEDSPLFVAIWYTVAIGALVGLGAIGANMTARRW